MNRKQFLHVHFISGGAEKHARLAHAKRLGLPGGLVHGYIDFGFTVWTELNGRVIGNVLEIGLNQIKGLRVNPFGRENKMTSRIGERRGHLLHPLARLEEQHFGAADGAVGGAIDDLTLDCSLRPKRPGHRHGH